MLDLGKEVGKRGIATFGVEELLNNSCFPFSNCSGKNEFHLIQVPFTGLTGPS